MHMEPLTSFSQNTDCGRTTMVEEAVKLNVKFKVSRDPVVSHDLAPMSVEISSIQLSYTYMTI